MENDVSKYHLTQREIDILYALWNAGRPLMASEIADEELKLTTVHTSLKRMLKKNLVEVVDFVKSGNVYGRSYRPLLTLTEYEMDRFCNDFKNSRCGELSVAGLIEILLDGLDKETLKKELDDLEQTIKEIREELSKKQNKGNNG